MPASFFRSTAAGGVFVMKVKDLSEKMVISTGRIVPASFWVRALNSFTNAMMLMPCGPSAVPTGGAGVACPAGICNFTNPATFLAMLPHTAGSYRARSRAPELPLALNVGVVADEVIGCRLSVIGEFGLPTRRVGLPQQPTTDHQ